MVKNNEQELRSAVCEHRQADRFKENYSVDYCSCSIGAQMFQRAAALLEENGMTDGLFLVRTSVSEPGLYVLSMSIEGGARHYKIDSHVSRISCFIVINLLDCSAMGMKMYGNTLILHR